MDFNLMETENKTKNVIRILYKPYFPTVNPDCPRFPALHSSVNCPFPGLMVEMLNVITKEAGLKIVPFIQEQLCEPPCPLILHLKFLNLTKLTVISRKYLIISYIIRRECVKNRTIDLIAYSSQKTDKRTNEFDYSERLYSVQTRLIRRVRDDPFSQMFSFFSPYDSKILLCVIIIWFLQWGCCILSQRLSPYSQSQLNVLDLAWQILRLQFLQYRNIGYQPTASATLSLSIFSFFQCYVLLGLFSSFIVASFLNPHIDWDNPIELLINGLNSGRYEFAGINNKNWFFDIVNNSNMYPYKYIRQALEKTPFKLAKSDKESFEMASYGKTLVFQQTDRYSYYLVQTYCDLIALEQGMPLVGAHLQMSKEHPLMPKLNEAIRNSRGKRKRILNKYENLLRKQRKCPPKGSFRPLQILPYIGALFICTGLFGLAIMILFVELLYFKCWK